MDTELRWVAQSYGDNWESFPNIAETKGAIGTGRQNTALILSVDANAPAAKACADYRGGGMSDWFLPSSDELNLMYKNLRKNNIGDFTDSWYWSSSQYYYGSYAWYPGFGDGDRNLNYKHYGGSVRAVRAF